VNYDLEISPPARKEIKELAGHVRAQALGLIEGLISSPLPSGAKELRGKPNIYRLWLAGRWRIAYQIDDDRRCVRILRVRVKADIDYESLASE
jgi:mRNA-degrading endonuclease RelE of RelBE toxin-antitoxin system